MERIEMSSPAQLDKLKQDILKTEAFYGLAAVTLGMHPEHGEVVLIETEGGSLLLAAKRVHSTDQ